MTRLDRHVRFVQGKLTLMTLLRALAWSLLVYAALVWVVILLGKFFQVYLPRPGVWFFSGLGVAALAALVYALVRKPTVQQAAVAIDDRLGLKEKFSTAIYVRPSRDPFAQAAVRDAERTADNVSLHNRFPVRVPVTFAGTAAVAVVAFLTLWLVPTVDLFGREEAQQKQQQAKRDQETLNKTIKDAIVRIDAAMPKAAENKEQLQLARQELVKLANMKDVKDPAGARRTAQRAVDDVKAIEKKIKEIQEQAQTQQRMREFEKLAEQPIDESTPVGKAQSELAKGNISAAIDNLEKAVSNFDQMAKEDQQKSAEQMQKMAAQLQQMANDKNVQQKMQQQLQQMGASQQMAQQMTQTMQKAANGDKQAQQQLQQMTNQLMQQMANQGQGLTQQQIAQVRQAVQQMQGQANNQAQAQQLAQAAQQMAQAMQQAAQPGQQPQGQQGQRGQGQQQQTAQGQQQGQGQQQNNQQNGGQPGGNAQQQMAQAQQQMQQQLQQMQAMAQDAQAMAARQQGNAPDGGDGQGGEGEQGQGEANGDGGEFAQGNPEENFGDGGQGGAAMATGPRPKGMSAPFGVKQEITRYQTDNKGKILASSFVKADAIRGDSKVGLSEAVAAAENDVTDEIEEERVSKQARQAVKEYFETIKEDAK